MFDVLDIAFISPRSLLCFFSFSIISMLAFVSPGLKFRAENRSGDCPESSGCAVLRHRSRFVPFAKHHSTEAQLQSSAVAWIKCVFVGVTWRRLGGFDISFMVLWCGPQHGRLEGGCFTPISCKGAKSKSPERLYRLHSRFVIDQAQAAAVTIMFGRLLETIIACMHSSRLSYPLSLSFLGQSEFLNSS